MKRCLKNLNPIEGKIRHPFVGYDGSDLKGLKAPIRAIMTTDYERISIASSSELWHWLEKNNPSTQSYLLVTWKKSTPEKYVSRDEVLDALIAYGWIDGRRYKLDDERTMQLICQRKQQKWTKTYRVRYGKLEDGGFLKPPGKAAADRAKEDGLWMGDEDVDKLVNPIDLVESLTKANAFQWWEHSAPSYRRNILRWLKSAKRSATRQKRLDKIAEYCSRGEKIPNY